MRRAASVRLSLMLVLIFICPSFAIGQISKADPSKVEHDNDDPVGRLLWFLEGRQTFGRFAARSETEPGDEAEVPVADGA